MIVLFSYPQRRSLGHPEKMKKTNETIANSMDGVFDDIPGHFTGIYRNLYNSVGDSAQLLEIKNEIEDKVDFSNLEMFKELHQRLSKKQLQILETLKVILSLTLIVTV
jgi:hypothetical protein